MNEIMLCIIVGVVRYFMTAKSVKHLSEMFFYKLKDKSIK